MTPQDLRIGNTVLYYGKEVTVLELTERLCRISHHDGYTWYHNIKPIPLTPEILERCGFDSIDRDDNNMNVNYTRTKDPQYWIQEHLDTAQFIFYGKDNSIEKVIVNLHQLQNLVFALKGKELEIK